MTDCAQLNITESLLAVQPGEIKDTIATDRLFEIAYNELRRLAAGLMRAERPEHTLQATALVHEAYCRLIDQSRVDWRNRAHFMSIAARAMREILVDYARRRAMKKRGGDWQRVALQDHLHASTGPDIELVELDEALGRLSELDERMARVVEFRVFAGLTGEEIAHVLGVTRRTVQQDWRMAKMWLTREVLGKATP
jgi:RNA polymerase sigma factor (TIGR02999 family)